MSNLERADDFDARRAHLQDLSDEELHARFWQLAEAVVAPLIAEARTAMEAALDPDHRQSILARAYAEFEPRCLPAARAAGRLLYETGELQAAYAMFEQALKVAGIDRDGPPDPSPRSSWPGWWCWSPGWRWGSCSPSGSWWPSPRSPAGWPRGWCVRTGSRPPTAKNSERRSKPQTPPPADSQAGWPARSPRARIRLSVTVYDQDYYHYFFHDIEWGKDGSRFLQRLRGQLQGPRGIQALDQLIGQLP